MTDREQLAADLAALRAQAGPNASAPPSDRALLGAALSHAGEALQAAGAALCAVAAITARALPAALPAPAPTADADDMPYTLGGA